MVDTPQASSELPYDPDDPRIVALHSGMVVAHWARTTPLRAALVTSSETVTYDELNRGANCLARALQARGLEPGDGVALMCGNRREFAQVWAACSRTGLRMTPINIHLQADEVRYIAEDCGARALFLDASLGERGTTAAESLTSEIKVAIGGDLPGFERFESFVAGFDDHDIEDPAPGVVMFYTSGTTGNPKGVHRPSVAENRLENTNLHLYDDGDVHLLTGPLYHAAPLAFSMAIPLAFGATVVLMDKWNAERALELIEDHGVTHTHMVPTMFHRLLALDEDRRCSADLSTLRFVLHGAAPCPVEVKHRLIDWIGPVVYEYYAATEGTGTAVDSATWLERPGTVGRPKPRGQVMVGDEEATPHLPGEVGLVWLRAPEVGRFEYRGAREKTDSAYRGDYFTLGDMGYMDEDGYLYLTDRSANLIISGGVNIYPAEVDAVLLEHPAVGDAATIGVPHEEWGEEVLAVIELQTGREPSDHLAGELIDHCRSRLAHFKCPRRVDFVEALPRADNGKIYKRLLRDQYRATSA